MAEAVAGRDCHQASRAASLPLYMVLGARQLLVPLQTDTLRETITLLRHKAECRHIGGIQFLV